MTPFQNSYIITARNSPPATNHANILPLSPSLLWFYMAPGQYNDETEDYKPVAPKPSAAPPAAFLSALTNDLEVAIQNGSPQLTVIIHGLGNLFNDSILEMAAFGSNLQTSANYPGLVISFDWPSYGELDSALYYAPSPYSLPPSTASGTVRGNINGTVQSFFSLITMLDSLRSQPGVQINMVCHSEGNYMLMLGMLGLASRQGGISDIDLNQVLLVAADINNSALQAPVNGQPFIGQGSAIGQMSTRVTIYSSTQDDVLPFSQNYLSAYHNPDYPDRLGLTGPSSFAAGALAGNAFGVDCSLVVNSSNIKNIPQVPPGTTVHSSYFYIPQVLMDMAQTMNGVAAGSVANRQDLNAPDGQSFQMELVSAPALTPELWRQFALGRRVL